MANVQSTIQFIQDHGHFAAVTADGLLALTECAYTVDGACAAGVDYDDRFFVEPTVFPIVDGNVSNRAVRDWLGY